MINTVNSIDKYPVFHLKIETEQLTAMSMTKLQIRPRKKIVIMKYQKTLIMRQNAMKVIHVSTMKK